jgi:sterol desaturase/sphingolipid hydroxylase (fatty acid hydroxylase superfamily)
MSADHFIRYFSGISFFHVVLPVYGLTLAVGALLTYYATGHAERGGFLEHSLPWRRWATASTKVDVALYLISKFTMKGIGALSAILAVVLATRLAQSLTPLLPLHGRWHAGPVAIGLICVALIVCVDLAEYLSHFVQHRVPALWAFHQIHHSATFLTPLTTYRFHPVGTLIDGVFVGVFLAVPACIAAMLYDLSAAQVVVMSGAADLLSSIILLNGLQHTHFPVSFGRLDRIFISPRMHQVHHSPAKRHWGKNLGSRLSIWDWWFGTGYLSPKGETLSFGIGAEEDARGDFLRVWWCLVGPVVECARMARRRLPSQKAAQTSTLTTPTAS